MRRPPDEVQALKEEIQAWLESQEGDLDHDTRWQTADEYYGDVHLTFPRPHYLVLRCGSALGDALFFGCAGLEPSTKPLDEFEEIVLGHGFWFYHKNEYDICITEEY